MESAAPQTPVQALEALQDAYSPVSYTHLTLPTIA